MGRQTVAYRGHLLTYHGGAIDGFHSQISFLPQHRIGAIVFTIGDHCAALSDIVTYNIYERLLDLEQTPSKDWDAIAISISFWQTSNLDKLNSVVKQKYVSISFLVYIIADLISRSPDSCKRSTLGVILLRQRTCS